MTSIMISIAASLVHTLAIMGYLSILACLAINGTQTKLELWIKGILRIFLFIGGIGSIFLAPAYLYGHFKYLITDEMFIAFGASEVVALIVLIISVKACSALLINIPKDLGDKE